MMREYELGQTVRFSITTRDAGGAMKAADAAPQYRVYADLGPSSEPLLGPAAMTAGQRAGHYFCEVALSTAGGFVMNGRYTVEMEATVDGVTDGAAVDFEVTARLARLNNRVEHTVETGVDRVYDRTGQTAIVVWTPGEEDGVIAMMPD